MVLTEMEKKINAANNRSNSKAHKATIDALERLSEMPKEKTHRLLDELEGSLDIIKSQIKDIT